MFESLETDEVRRRLFVIGVFSFSVLDMGYRYALVEAGYAELWPDATEVYLPMARAVMRGGDLYVAHWDNKPPLFQFLNLAAAATGEYMMAFYLFLGLAHALTAYLIWKLLSRYDVYRIAVVATVLYLFALPIVHGRVIDGRPFANVFILSSFLLSSPLATGASIAVAGLFTQYSVFVIPAVVLYHWHSQQVTDRIGWASRFCISGFSVLSLSFLCIAAIWGMNAMVAGLNYTFLGGVRYVGHYSQSGLSLVGGPVVWLGNEWQGIRSQSFLYFFAAIAVWKCVTEDRPTYHLDESLWVFAFALVLLSVPRLIRNVEIYHILTLPFLSILAAVGLINFLDDS